MTEREIAKRILLEIVRQSGGALRKRTRLYKAFYLAHLYFYRDNLRIMSTWPIVRMPKGPGIDDGSELTEELVEEGLLHVGSAPIGPYTEEVFTLVRDNIETGLDETAVKAIREAVEFVTLLTAKQLSHLLHEHSRSWRINDNGRPLNIYVDSIPDDEYERLTKQHQEISKSIASVFGG